MHKTSHLEALGVGDEDASLCRSMETLLSLQRRGRPSLAASVHRQNSTLDRLEQAIGRHLRPLVAAPTSDTSCEIDSCRGRPAVSLPETTSLPRQRARMTAASASVHGRRGATDSTPRSDGLSAEPTPIQATAGWKPWRTAPLAAGRLHRVFRLPDHLDAGDAQETPARAPERRVDSAIENPPTTRAHPAIAESPGRSLRRRRGTPHRGFPPRTQRMPNASYRPALLAGR